MTEPGENSPKVNVPVMIEQIVKSLVEEPDLVEINLVEEPQETVLELKVAPRDIGKVIGKQGRTVRAMRNLLSAAGVRSNKNFALEIMEEEEDAEAAASSP